MEKESFLKRLDKFRNEKVPLLGSISISSPLRERRPVSDLQDSQQALQHGMTFPFEVFLDVPASVRKRRFLEDVKVGTVVLGKIVHIRLEAGLVILPLELVTGQKRFIKDLDFQAVCPRSEFENVSDHNDCIDEFRAGDVVRAVVFAVDAVQEQLSVSFRRFRLPRESRSLELGLVSEEDAEIILKRAEAEVEELNGFSHQLKHTAGFSNPHCIDNLLHELGVSSQLNSFLGRIQSIQCQPDDYREELRKKQSHAWAMETVAAGVGYLKSGNMEKAEKHFDHALLIEPHNVEAYVARGALYANENRHENAVKDFQEALKLNPKHKNARKYLAETQATRGNSCFNKGDLEAAMDFYRAALQINPDLESAQSQLQAVETKVELLALRAAAAKAKEKEESKRATSLYKLRQLITDEKIARTGNKSDHKEKRKKTKDKKGKKAKHKKSRNLEKRRHSSRRSRESPSSEDQSLSNSQTPSPARERRERSWTYSDASPTPPKRTDGQRRTFKGKSMSPYLQQRRLGPTASPRRLDSPSDSQKARQYRQRQRSRSRSPQAKQSRDETSSSPLERTRGMRLSPGKEPSPRLPARYSPRPHGVKRLLLRSRSRSASPPSIPSDLHRDRGRDKTSHRRSSSETPRRSPNPLRRKRPFLQSRSRSRSPPHQPHRSGDCRYSNPKMFTRGPTHYRRQSSHSPGGKRSRESRSRSGERQRHRSPSRK